MTNYEKYIQLHSEVMDRLEAGEITTEMAKEVTDLAFDKYVGNTQYIQTSYEYDVSENAIIDLSIDIANAYYTESAESENTTAEDSNKKFFNNVIDAIKTFFEKCRQYMKNAIQKIKDKLHKEYTSAEFRKAMAKFQYDVEYAIKHKKGSVRYFDMDKAYDCFNQETAEYIKVLTSISKSDILGNRDDSVDGIIKKCEDIRKKYDEKLHEIVRDKKEYSIGEARALYSAIEREYNAKYVGVTTGLMEYEDCIDKLESMIVEIIDDLSKQVEYEESLTPEQRETRNKKIERARKFESWVMKVGHWAENHALLIAGAVVATPIVIGITSEIIDANR